VRPPCQRNYQKPQEDPRTIGGGLKELGSQAAEKLQTIRTSRPDMGILMVSTKTLGRRVKKAASRTDLRCRIIGISAAIYPDEPIPHGARRSAGGSEEPSFSTRSL
jgi:hypothetical protein